MIIFTTNKQTPISLLCLHTSYRNQETNTVFRVIFNLDLEKKTMDLLTSSLKKKRSLQQGKNKGTIAQWLFIS